MGGSRKDLEAKTKMTEWAVKACHKETGISISELASLLVRMTKEAKEITELLEKNSTARLRALSVVWIRRIPGGCSLEIHSLQVQLSCSPVISTPHRHSFFSLAFLFFLYDFLFFILGLLYFRYLGCNCIESPEFWSPKV